MRLKIALSAAVASLLFAAPVLAQTAPTTEQARPEGHGGHGDHGLHRIERMQHRLDRAVENGRLTREQADQFLAEARQLHEEAQALRQANGGQLTEQQRQQFRERKQALRQKVFAALKPAQGA